MSFKHVHAGKVTIDASRPCKHQWHIHPTPNLSTLSYQVLDDSVKSLLQELKHSNDGKN